MGIKYHDDLEQGSVEWMAARCGLLTASEMRFIYRIPVVDTRVKKDGTPYKQRDATKSEEKAEKSHFYELLAQRITRYVEPGYEGDAMIRGTWDEISALEIYNKHYAQTKRMGFITNDRWGFTLGYSPDDLVGERGQIECKSRNQKLQMRTLIEYSANDKIDPDFMVQVQTGLLVSERDWCDVVSYCGGLPMATVRVLPDPQIQVGIIEAASAFESRMTEALERYKSLLASSARLVPTERRIEEEMH